MTAAEAEIRCGNQVCRVAETGKCVEGLALDKCPYIVRDGLPAVIPEQEVSPATEEIIDLLLASSERFALDRASQAMRAVPTIIVGIVGQTSSGKTSLIASLCELFQKGNVGKHRFASSGTLFAFEQACHHARAVSRRTSPETEHTGLASGLGFYHLLLERLDTTQKFQILLADRSGEDYRSVADDPASAAAFVEIRRADVITVLVNGALLLDIGARHNAKQDALMILQGLMNGDVLSPEQRLAVVLTKRDVICDASADVRNRVDDDFESLMSRLRDIFGSLFAEIRSFSIAASPASTTLSHGFGVAELLEFWSAKKPAEHKRQPPIQATRAFGRFGMSDGEILS